MTDVYEFYNLGIGDPIPVSAASQLGIGDMLDEVVKHFDEDQLEEAEDERPRIAVVGKPNVGKSSIINKLIGENRVIVSNVEMCIRDRSKTPWSTIAPPKAAPWPSMYLVVEWVTISAPHSKGRQFTGLGLSLIHI